ncbi:MAG: cysteine synthase family protein [Tepidisphaeraceae bacterium]
MTTRSVLDLIGSTPLIELSRLHRGPGRILAKCEFLNPGGSMKDRAALQIVRDAERSQRLTPGQPVVEMTSGNMGAGLAVVCAAMRHPFVAVMSRGNSPARAKQMAALGAEVVLVDQVDGSPGRVTGRDLDVAVQRARAISAERLAFYVDQFHNASGVRAHESTTGKEIWEQTGGAVDVFACAVGTGASLVGVSKHLRSRSAGVRVFAVEPARSRPLAGHPIESAQHVLQGTGYGNVPPLWEDSTADGYLSVSDDEAVACQRNLGRLEGLFVGLSSAANTCAAIKLAQGGDVGDNPTIATLLCDTGLKYV